MIYKIGCLIIDIEGKEISNEDREILAHPLVGGLILFTRNYESRAQLKQLVQSIRSVRKDPLLIMVDQEGGRVQRFINEFTRLPCLGALGKLYDKDADKALYLTQDCGWLMAIELLSVGIDLSLAPVLDLNKKMNQVIGDRSFHADPIIVTKLAEVYIQGMQEAGMAATGKHFPGHGSVSADSHVSIPNDERQISEIEVNDMIPFVNLIKAGIAAIMPAHIVFTNVDARPVGFSNFWLAEVLRKRLGFKGVIFSDDLNMKGADISSNYVDRVVLAREAGCDFALLCNNRHAVIPVLDHLNIKPHQVAKEKWGPLQGYFAHKHESYKTNQRWHETQQYLRFVNE